jgi:hypothetical protein
MAEVSEMNSTMMESRFDFISGPDKDFIIAFDNEMNGLGYDFGNNIGSGFCWGRYMIIYSKTGVKSKSVTSRVYIRTDGSIVLRLFLNGIDRHRDYIENSEPYIRDVLTGTHGDCSHCKNDKGGVCKFRKTYTLGGRLYEKCNGIVFEFHKPDISKLPGYIGLLSEFYKTKRGII